MQLEQGAVRAYQLIAGQVLESQRFFKKLSDEHQNQLRELVADFAEANARYDVAIEKRWKEGELRTRENAPLRQSLKLLNRKMHATPQYFDYQVRSENLEEFLSQIRKQRQMLGYKLLTALSCHRDVVSRYV